MSSGPMCRRQSDVGDAGRKVSAGAVDQEQVARARSGEANRGH